MGDKCHTPSPYVPSPIVPCRGLGRAGEVALGGEAGSLQGKRPMVQTPQGTLEKGSS